MGLGIFIKNRLITGSIARRLYLLVFLISILTLSILFVFFYATNKIFLYENRKNDIESVINILSDSSEAALAFDDQEAAHESLLSLKYKTYIIAGGLYNANNHQLASWGDEGLLKKLSTFPNSEYSQFEESTFYVKKDVLQNQHLIGHIVIICTTEDIENTLKSFTITTLLVLSLTLFLALGISRIFVTQIITSLKKLSLTANEIAVSKNYSKKVEIKAWDEFENFILSFNAMLQEIRLKDDTLEKKVADRTADLLIAKDQAEAANKAKSHFLANMSHEIRTPLNGVLGMIDSLLLTKTDKEQEDLLKTANFSGKLLLQIVNDILDFSKIQEGKLEICPTPEDLYSYIGLIGKITEEKLKKKDISFVCTIEEGTSQYLMLDSFRLRQVLLNVLDNASKFTEAGGAILLYVNSTPLDNEQATVHFNISDSGIGIEQKKIEEIFAPFSQEDTSTTRKYGGTGLGLTICKQLVHLMHGTLVVKSRKNVGSVFSIDIPLQIAQASQVAESGSRATKEQQKTLAQCPYRILLAEDNLVNQKVAKSILEKQGATVITANNGKEVLAIKSKEEFDIILMDIQMPIMDGVHATMLIREAEQSSNLHIPIIALTAHALEDEKQRYLAAGMDGYVTKPIDKHLLIEEICRLISNP